MIENVARAKLIDELALTIDQFLSHQIERDTLACDLTQDELTELSTGLVAIAAWNTRASDAEIARLNIALKMQAAAVRTLHANEQTEINMLRAKAREAHIAIATLDSEREANAILTEALRAADERVNALREALVATEGAIAEYYRYWTGGETRGSYDGKPERAGLWKAQQIARQAIAAALKEQPHD